MFPDNDGVIERGARSEGPGGLSGEACLNCVHWHDALSFCRSVALSVALLACQARPCPSLAPTILAGPFWRHGARASQSSSHQGLEGTKIFDLSSVPTSPWTNHFLWAGFLQLLSFVFVSLFFSTFFCMLWTTGCNSF